MGSRKTGKRRISPTSLAGRTLLEAGAGQHLFLLDLIATVEDPIDEEIVRLIADGKVQEEVAEMLGLNQSTVSRRLKRMRARAK